MALDYNKLPSLDINTGKNVIDRINEYELKLSDYRKRTSCKFESLKNKTIFDIYINKDRLITIVNPDNGNDRLRIHSDDWALLKSSVDKLIKTTLQDEVE